MFEGSKLDRTYQLRASAPSRRWSARVKLAATKDKPKPESSSSSWGIKSACMKRMRAVSRMKMCRYVKGSVLKFTGLEGTALDMPGRQGEVRKDV